MILGIHSNIITRLQSKREQQKYNCNFKSNALALQELGEPAVIIPFRKVSEKLSSDTVELLIRVAEVLNRSSIEIGSFVRTLSAKLMASKIVRKWDRKGIEAWVATDVKTVTSLSNALVDRPSNIPLRKVVAGSSGLIKGDYQVIEGRKVFDIYLPGTPLGGEEGSIRASKTVVSRRKSFNAEVQRIINSLLPKAPKKKRK